MRYILLLLALPALGFSSAQKLDELPLCFIQNRGQVDDEVHFYVQGADKTVYFTSQGVTFALAGEKRWAVKLDFLGAFAQPKGKARQQAIYSYFKGSREEWKTSVPVFGEIVYEELWPGINLIYKGNAAELKYEFHVKPGADADQIQLGIRGATSLTVNGQGELEVSTPAGSLKDGACFAYQGDVEVSMRYVVERDRVRFEVGDYDRERTLVLDPCMLVYCGYIGGEGVEKSYDIEVDEQGCAYVTGYTNSEATSFPAAVGPDLSYNGGNDAYIAKIRADGTGFVYCGYIGGSDDDAAFGVTVDSEGCAYVTGRTLSDETSFPVKVGPDLTHGGSANGHDAFIVKVNATGTDLVYAGYIGGSEVDGGYSVVVDAMGAAYVSGWSESPETSLPVKVGPDLTHNGGEDVFVAKLNPSGSGFEYLGYIGGNGNDGSLRLEIDQTGAAYITGWVESDENSFPTVVGPDLQYNGLTDAFVAKLNPSGTALDFCGYLGGENNDYGLGITVDDDGTPYVVGWTYSDELSFPVKRGPCLTHGGRCDGYVAKVDPSGSDLVYCGYIGGDKSDYCLGVRVDGKGQAHVAGGTWSEEATFPVKLGPDLSFNGGGWDIGDAYVARLTAQGDALVFCGYIGGAEDDGGHSLAMDSAGNMYVTGWTLSPEAGFPETVGPDLTYGGGTIWVGDGFVAKVSPPTFYPDTDQLSETGGTVNFALEAGLDHGNRNYVILGGLTGTEPGYALPGGLAALPVNWDLFTDWMVGFLNTPVFSGFLGSLDASGKSAAQFNAPAIPAGFVGVKLYFAYCLNNPFDFASNPAVIEIVP